MIIAWTYALLALVLLLPPIPFSKAARKSLISIRRNNLADVPGAVRVWQNWVDLVRAALGGYLLISALTPVNPEPGAGVRALVIEAGILSTVLLVQIVRFFRGPQLMAPVFYLCGLTLFLGGDLFAGDFQGIFAVVVGWLFASFGKNLNYQLPTMAVALAVAGFVLGLGPPLILCCALILLPHVVALLFRKPLLFAASIPAS